MAKHPFYHCNVSKQALIPNLPQQHRYVAHSEKLES